MKDTKILIFSATQLINILFKKKNSLALFLFIILYPFSINSQDLRDKEHTLKFADYLFKTQQYILASEEYERAVYYDSTNNTALLKLFQSYRYAEKHDIVAARFAYFFSDSIYFIRTDFAKEYIKNLVMSNKYQKLYSYLDKNTSLSNSDKETYQLGSLLLQKKWDTAFNYALKHPVTTDKKNADLHVLAFNSKQTKYKKPFTAALFSAIIPGTGKMYTKNWKDGVISLIFVGVNAWQSYRGFKKYGNESAYGWIFAGFATTFYLGNIFGSHKSAKKYNKKLDDEIYHNTWHLMVDDM